MEGKEERASNIELLRIVAVMGVIIQHYSGDLRDKLDFILPGSTSKYALEILISMFICAVNVFILISGYFMSISGERKVWKPFRMLAQVILFSISAYLISCFMGHQHFVLENLVKRLIPTDYFVNLYITLYLISPYINVVLNTLSEKKLRQMLAIFLFMFSIWPTGADILEYATGHSWIGLSTIGAYGSQRGFTIVNFSLLYMLGAYIRIREKAEGQKKSIAGLAGIYGICVAVMSVWAHADWSPGWEYCNPVVILEAICVFLIFMRLNIGQKKGVNVVAKGVFGVYLFHTNFFGYIPMSSVIVRNPLILVIYIFLISMGIYGVCWCVDRVYRLIMNRIYAALLKYICFPVIKV